MQSAGVDYDTAALILDLGVVEASSRVIQWLLELAFSLSCQRQEVLQKPRSVADEACFLKLGLSDKLVSSPFPLIKLFKLHKVESLCSQQPVDIY